MNHTKPVLSAIAATAENRVIGLNNKMPWHMPADLKHFKEITSGSPVLMGRKTYESIGKPLPNRTNIILTRDAKYPSPEDCIVVTNIDTAISMANELSMDEIFVIGGAEIYQQLLPKIQRVYLTEIHHTFEGDAFFPELSKSEWKEISREQHRSDDKNPYDYSFVVLERV
ncbi:MAG TPA: dihydrofolate reductase [Gammaproteobacteria bacterium]|jgi:dihydrofolate reductase|nr:dihydrofolate reductase [Gammaproteobacteria bacterium]